MHISCVLRQETPQHKAKCERVVSAVANVATIICYNTRGANRTESIQEYLDKKATLVLEVAGEKALVWAICLGTDSEVPSYID